MTFQLDTSVFVTATPVEGERMGYRWSDISPFTQGYIEALFAELERDSIGARVGAAPSAGERLHAENLTALRAHDVLMHDRDGQMMFSGRTKIANGPARVEVRATGGGWRMIGHTAFRFHARPHSPAFSDLAPETLARIIADCASWRSTDRGVYSNDWESSGRSFWAMRQSRVGVPDFPPLTLQLGDDGKVVFA